mmetsp:Transcript_27308/g.71445  ORF Transcript_27308/g.71445 Transcript_27308/m.71445 type:complete len:220 (+) Transcript_27308:823-1482(+)
MDARLDVPHTDATTAWSFWHLASSAQRDLPVSSSTLVSLSTHRLEALRLRPLAHTWHVDDLLVRRRDLPVRGPPSSEGPVRPARGDALHAFLRARPCVRRGEVRADHRIAGEQDRPRRWDVGARRPRGHDSRPSRASVWRPQAALGAAQEGRAAPRRRGLLADDVALPRENTVDDCGHGGFRGAHPHCIGQGVREGRPALHDGLHGAHGVHHGARRVVM